MNYEKSIGAKMNDLDLSLEVVSRSCQPLRWAYIRCWISRKPLQTEAWLEWTDNRKWRIEWRYFRFEQIQDGGRRHLWKISNGHISATSRPIHFMFGSRVGFSGTADLMALFSNGHISICLSVRLSVTLVSCDHIGWDSSKIISPLVSLGCSLFATPTWRVCSQGTP